MRGLPKIKIDYDNSALGQAIASADGLLCLICVGAVAIERKFELAKHYALRRLADLESLGIESETNPELYNMVAEFYTEAQEGTKVYVVGYPSTLTMSAVLDKANPYARKIVEATNGEVRGLIVTQRQTEDATFENALDSDISKAMLNAQALGDWAAEVRFAPIFTLIDGVEFSGEVEELEDLTKQSYNRVGVVIGAQESGAVNQSIGLIAGRIASVPVHRNIGRVRDGALSVMNIYVGNEMAEVADVETIHERGYITFRTFTGRSGYYISFDPLATKATDDYNQLTRRRVIDKAYRIAYGVLVDKLVDEIPVNRDGTMLETYASSFELSVENAIATNMTARGELSTDPANSSDRGVECVIDRTVNVIATSEVKAELRVRPHGYSKYISVLLGFTIIEG